MITTNLITFELTFKNSTETIIFNTSKGSLLMVVDFLKSYSQANTTPLLIDKVKEYSRTQSKFLRATKQRLIGCSNHITELNLILTSKR
jgi:hypothetical protein